MNLNCFPLSPPRSTMIISKSCRRDIETYSGFEGTELEACLRKVGVQRLYIGGLATDYCVLNTVKDGLRRGFGVRLLKEAIRAVNVKEGDGERAEEEMVRLGAILEMGGRKGTRVTYVTFFDPDHRAKSR